MLSNILARVFARRDGTTSPLVLAIAWTLVLWAAVVCARMVAESRSAHACWQTHAVPYLGMRCTAPL